MLCRGSQEIILPVVSLFQVKFKAAKAGPNQKMPLKCFQLTMIGSGLGYYYLMTFFIFVSKGDKSKTQ